MAKIKKEIKELKAELEKPNVWQDQKRAVKLGQDLKADENLLSAFQFLKTQIDELSEIKKLGKADKAWQKEYIKQSQQIKKKLASLEEKSLLVGPYDQANVFLTISAGVGGVEAQDWVEMLLRMYLRFFESKGWTVDIIQTIHGEEAGIKSAQALIKGDWVYGYLKNEKGVHRLVRQSPFNADNLRQTSFAKVEVMPELADGTDVEISPVDIEVDTFRASGAGGQKVNKTSSAVRIKHNPSGLVVECQNERSQAQNKATALKILKAKLLAEKLAKEEQVKQDIKGKVVSSDWGQQIRSYVLHPYKMVKDLRTKYEDKNAEAVLDGKLDGFIQAELGLKG